MTQKQDARLNVLTFPNGIKAKVFEGCALKEALKWTSELKEPRRNLDDSFYICDLGEVANKYGRWSDLFPSIRPFYAVKVAPHFPLVGSLVAMGAGFDCASQEEIDTVLACGASPDDIVYANPNKMVSHVVYARTKGVKLTVFDSILELHKMKKHYPESELLLRIKTDMKWSVFPDPYGRFGATLEQSRDLLREAKELNMNVVGVCFHIGCVSNDARPFIAAFRDAREVFDFAEELGFEFSLLDIGGGFPGVTTEGCSVEEIAKTVYDCLNDMFPSFSAGTLRVISEPGRYFAAAPFTLATSVICKDMKTNSDVDVEYVINEGKYGSFCADSSPREPFVLDLSSKTSRTSRVFGPTCSPYDVVLAKATLPELNIGDWLFWRNLGAYTFSMSSGFNGFQTKVFYNVLTVENESVFYHLCGGKVRSVAMNDDGETEGKN